MSINTPPISTEATELIVLIAEEYNAQHLAFDSEWEAMIVQEGIDQTHTVIRPIGRPHLPRPNNNDLTILQELHDMGIITLWLQDVFDNPVWPTSIVGNGPPLLYCSCLLRGPWLSAVTSLQVR
jgi:hypothetical protein